MTYQEEIIIKLQNAGFSHLSVEELQELARFIEIEAVPLKAEIMRLKDINIISEAIENHICGIGKNITHSHYANELYYGYCSNGFYELRNIDVEELAESIKNR